jgi:hypothetical protein
MVIYQDRLATNIGKALLKKKRYMRFLALTDDSEEGFDLKLLPPEALWRIQAVVDERAAAAAATAAAAAPAPAATTTTADNDDAATTSGDSDVDGGEGGPEPEPEPSGESQT